MLSIDPVNHCTILMNNVKVLLFQGILCVSPPSLAPGDSVKVMADTQAKCLKGAKFFEGEMRHVANGILRVSRDALFRF